MASVDAKISRWTEISRSTYARAEEICFAPKYRTQQVHMWCARRVSQFDLQLTRRVDVKFKSYRLASRY